MLMNIWNKFILCNLFQNILAFGSLEVIPQKFNLYTF